MPNLSAADAISPAIQRTRTFLFRPFRFGTYLKLCLVALLTEGFGSNFNSSGGGSSRHHSTGTKFGLTPLNFHFAPVEIAMAVAMLALALVISLALFYLVTRLRFAYFHSLVHNIRQIRPGWNLYRAPARRFFWMNVAVGLCFLLFAAAIALPFMAGFLRLFHESKSAGHLDVGLLLSLLLPLIPIIFILGITALAIDLLLRDCLLPHYALENATAEQAWAAAWARIRAEKGQFFVYALLRIILPLIGLILLFVILIIPGIIFIAVTAVLEVAIHAVFSGGSGPATFIGIFFQVLVGFIAFVIALIVGIGVGGPLSTAIREYAIVFYGARYRLLGDILFPPPPTPIPPLASAPATT
jgi:hypothetical protein